MKTLRLTTLLLAAASLSQADSVITNDGAKLTGTITRIDQGVIHMDTPYAGSLQIKQEQVASFQTDTPVVVRLESGTVMSGPVQSTEIGKLKIESSDGILETSTAKVIASWAPTEEDPDIVRLRAEQEAMQRKWKYRGSLDLTGKAGNTEKLNIGGQFEAVLKSPNDELKFHAEYEQGKENGNKTDDRIAGGSSYESFYSETYGWYVRTQLETDKIDNIDLRSTSGAGISYRLINNDTQTLIARCGLGYRYTAYDNGKPNESSPTIDLSLEHTYTFKDDIYMQNSLTYVPSLDDYGVYTIVHDSGIEIPVGNSDNWKIRIGMKNDYESEPAAENHLDTSYYTKMIYTWD
jgi:putative salt-induced outer membrane protein YdiY